MDFDLDKRTAALSVGEFSAFITGPRDSGGGFQGIWRAQLGTHWHNELRAQASVDTPSAEFEIPITGRVYHHGWTLTLTGRIDQLLRTEDNSTSLTLNQGRHGHASITLREIKTVTRPLPVDESELRAAYPEYFAQLAAYAAIMRQQGAGISPAVTKGGDSTLLLPARLDAPDDADRPTGPSKPVSSHRIPKTPSEHLRDNAEAKPQVRAELIFVEASSGLAQTLALTPADETFFRVQLERVVEFLNLRLRARERLRHLSFRPAFATPRPGQETTQADLTATFERQPLVLFEAPTGFGKTGVLLEFALGQLRAGHFERALYLTSKSTGQIQVVRTLSAMTEAPQNSCHVLRDKTSGEALEAGCAVPVAGEGSRLKVESNNPPDAITPQSNPKPRTQNSERGTATPVAVWHVRNKSEHCINHTFHCVRENCAYLDQVENRWPQSGLARFYLDEKHPRDLDTLRAAGRAARICPYEITRAALAFNDVWIGDYNYVFAPRNRGLFFEQPGFDPARTLLLLDEAHNLPSRVADVYSHTFNASDAFAVRDELNRTRPLATLVNAWDHWCHLLSQLKPVNSLPLDDEDDARHLLGELAKLIASVPLDLAALGPVTANLLWQIPSLVDELSASELPRLWWCPRDGELELTCLDAAAAIGATLREFGGVVLASATLTPIDGFAAACGLDDFELGMRFPARPEFDRLSTATAVAAAATSIPERLGTLNKRDTRKLYKQLTSASDLLRVEEARDAASPALLRAHTPWRDGAYDIAFDARVDTTFQHRSHHYTLTASTIAALHTSAIPRVAASASEPKPNSPLASSLQPTGNVAVFFPSYAYAEAIRSELISIAPTLRVSLQPRVRDLAAQAAWVNESLLNNDVLFLVLGSSFAESIDALGGRVSHAMVVGPALPEVNPVQHARLAEASRAGLARDAAFRRVYQIPGMTKVNQALGRLVRAPGQRARVLLHCRRFLEPSYANLLAQDYQTGAKLFTDTDFAAWLAGKP